MNYANQRGKTKETTMNYANQRLESFGAAVLRMMEQSPEWSADTFEEFQAAADELGLAGVDRSGNFKRRKVLTGTSNLAKFGAQVLAYMKTTKEWDPADIDIFAEVAVSGRLATVRDGVFKAARKGMWMDVPDPRARARKKTNPSRFRVSSFQRGELVMGIQGVDGGYVGTVVSTSTDGRGRHLVTFRDEDGRLRETFATNLTRSIPERGRYPRKNPLASGAPIPAAWIVNRGAARMT